MIDVQELRKTFDVFKTSNNMYEIEVINMQNKGDNYSGIYDDFELLSRDIQRFDTGNYNLYFRINELKDAVKGKMQYNKFVRGAKGATDTDIKHRDWLFLDFDPIREGGVKDIASTEEEMEKSHLVAVDCYRYLKKQDFPEPVVCKSGNGWHILYKLDQVQENGEETKTIFKNFLAYLALQFTTAEVDLDLKNINASRLTKLYSTVSRKGANIAERPHRKSEIVKVPSEIKPVSWDKVVELANRYVTSQQTDPTFQNTQTKSFNSQSKFDLMEFLSKNGIEILRTERAGTSTKYILKTCPFHEEHGKDSAIFVADNGAITWTCFHSSCANYSWRDLRLKFDPHAYDRQQYEQRPQRQEFIPYQEQQKRKKYEIKEELPELGEKWFSMSSIKKVDLTQLEKVTTGFHEIDKSIVGLYMSEVTVLSGSNSSGKSSWLNSLLLNIVQQGTKIALWSGELRPDILKTWIQMVAAGKNNLKPSKYGDGKYYVPDHIGERIDSWLDGKFFVYNNEYGTKFNQIFHDMNELIKVGVKVFALDNLFSLDIDLFDGDKNNKQRETIIQIKDFAKKNGVHIILVAHPRKVMSFLRKNDISGSSDITNAVDNVFIMHRVNQDFTKAVAEFYDNSTASRFTAYGNVLAIEKNRMYGAVDVMCGLHYESESRRFKNDIAENIIYGWQEQAEQASLSMPSNDSFAQAFTSSWEEPYSGWSGATIQEEDEYPF